jgi:hypothetical protein
MKISKQFPNQLELKNNEHNLVVVVSPLVKRAPGSVHTGTNHKNAKIGYGHLEMFFSSTTGPGKLFGIV